MNDTEISMNEHAPPSSVDDDRKSLLWEKREEDLLMKWSRDIVYRRKKHEIKGRQNKFKYILFSIPTILIPIGLSGIASIVECDSLEYNLAIMASGLFSGLNMFFNFTKKEQLHNYYATRYFELSTEIEFELSKPKVNRMDCSIYMERIKLQYSNLCQQAPNL